MKVEIAFNPEETRQITFQTPFPKTTECCRCGGDARLAFVAYEFDTEPNSGKFVCNLYENKGGLGDAYWLHDAACFAVYLCKKCLEPTALYNQA